jgi:hypothetical protein
VRGGWLIGMAGVAAAQAAAQTCLAAHETPTLSSLVEREKMERWKNRE